MGTLCRRLIEIFGAGDANVPAITVRPGQHEAERNEYANDSGNNDRGFCRHDYPPSSDVAERLISAFGAVFDVDQKASASTELSGGKVAFGLCNGLHQNVMERGPR